MNDNKNKKRFVVILGVVVLIIIGFLAVGMNKKTPTGDATSKANTMDSSATDTSKAVATNSIMIQNYMFSPMAARIKVGDTVTWTNMDSVRHNVVADTASADAPNGPLIGKGETYTFTFKKAGTYTFHCEPHPYMKGTVVVTE